LTSHMSIITMRSCRRGAAVSSCAIGIDASLRRSTPYPRDHGERSSAGPRREKRMCGCPERHRGNRIIPDRRTTCTGNVNGGGEPERLRAAGGGSASPAIRRSARGFSRTKGLQSGGTSSARDTVWIAAHDSKKCYAT
jgi:hypothetical protein